MNRAHPLDEVVEAGWAPSKEYLQVRLRRGEIRGKKVGREWRMSDKDIEMYLESISNQPSELRDLKSQSPVVGLTAASMRRRSA
jgi:hypothetical protein